MKARITEHDDRLELVIDCETYEEHILLKAFLREHATARYVPISEHRAGGDWSLTLGQCGCEARMLAREAFGSLIESEVNGMKDGKGG